MRILLGMSGGLDSSFSALKLKEEGHSVEGAVLIMHDYTELEPARLAARELGIVLHEIDCREKFDKKVVADFMSCYSKGRTPNPCVVCNREVKFSALREYAVAHGFDKVATGHYAGIKKTENGERSVIFRALDERKDQSYMLWRLTPEIIDMLIFPLSDLTKEMIRAEAGERGLSAAEKKDSQEICFIPSDDYGAYIENRLGKFEEGDFVDSDGRILGRHKGIIHYTVGQRKGLGIALGARAFITDIDPATNKISLSFSPKETDFFTVSDMVFSGISPMNVGEIRQLLVKVRYQAPPVLATVKMISESRAEVKLLSPARSVTAGQSAVFYDGAVLAFGGFID
ncbi:MAG: tRNA 2-thiouridine(34) synthase MnmA [Clostridia bacterium]|nr:tRNA 2-thiouridine(34) synthase MnmA [Clostridia bacterium]